MKIFLTALVTVIKRRKIAAAVIFSSIFIASWGYAQGQTPLLSDKALNKAAYQKYLKDQDKKFNEINYLLDLIENSSLSFERNGAKGSGKNAAKLLKYKLNQDKNKIQSTEDFIEKVASFSSHTQKSYYVITPQGNKLLLKDQLYIELNKLRRQSNKGSKKGK